MGLKTVAILYIFGATIASGQFMPKLRPTPYDMSVMSYLRSNGCPSAPELAPVICLFMKPHMGLFKPQLNAPSTYIPPLVVENCDKPQPETVFPPKKTIVIPEAPILPPITIPKFPVSVFEPLPLAPIVEPTEPAPITVTSDAADVMVTGLNIPTGSVLPPLEMANFQDIVEIHGADMSEAFINDQSLMAPHSPAPALVIPEFPAVSSIEPCLEDEPFPVPIPEFIRPLAPIPPAPELPPARLPEIPVHIKIPFQPIRLPMIMEQGVQTIVMPEFPSIPMISPCPEDEPIPVPIPEFIQPLRPISAAPVLPPARLPEMPVYIEIPPQPMQSIITEHVEEPCITGEIIHHPKPMLIPQPPRIPQPTPVFVAHEQAIISDPCEPAIQPGMQMGGHPYFFRSTPFIPAPARGPVLYPGRRMLPYMRRILKTPSLD